MSAMNDDQLDDLVRGLAHGPDAPAPPPRFAERVLDAHARSVDVRRRARFAASLAGAAALGAAACLALVVGVVGVGGASPAAVALTTPHGTLAGVRFTADVAPDDLTPEDSMLTAARPFPRTIAAAAAGALAGAALTVAVTAGELTLTNDAGAVDVKAGEVATVVAGAPPSKERQARSVSDAERARLLRDENDGLRAALEAARSGASTGEVGRLVAENQALREKLKKADEEAALLDDLRKAQEGEPHGFPEDLPPRFAEASLQKAFDDALNAAGIEGGVIEIDCKEYPCVVYGQLSSKNDMDKLRETPAFAPYKDDSDMTSIWHTKKDKDGKVIELAYFGVSLAPKPAQEGGDADLNKRTSWRMQQAADTLFPRDQR